MNVPRQRSGGPITLERMGSFFFAGDVATDDSGNTSHGDHGYVQYFVPTNAREVSLIMWHGGHQSGKTWESTPDGREGFWQIFLRRGWPVNIIDQPRRGRAGKTLGPGSEAVPAVAQNEGAIWTRWRLGIWKPPAPRISFPHIKFPMDSDSLAQFFRQCVPNTGPEPFPDREHRQFMGSAVADLARQVGPSVLFTHSHSGQYGWETVMQEPRLIEAVIAFEPGEFAFPDDQPAPSVPTESEQLAIYLAPQMVSSERFAELTRVPILIVMGDNISTAPDSEFGIELWRLVRIQAQQFVEAVNERGGDAIYLELPEVGLQGNTHFPMTDLNNVEVADIISHFLDERSIG